MHSSLRPRATPLSAVQFARLNAPRRGDVFAVRDRQARAVSNSITMLNDAAANSIDERYQRACDRAERAGQGHLLAHWPTLSLEEQQQLLLELEVRQPSSAFRWCTCSAYVYRRSCASSPQPSRTGVLPPLSTCPRPCTRLLLHHPPQGPLLACRLRL